MKNYFKQNKLDKNQKETLEAFIKIFLPKRGNKRKNSGNEIDYIGTALDKVFIKHFGFNLSRQNIIDTFENLNYDIFTKNSDWNPEVKKYKPSLTGDSIRYGDGYLKHNASFIYVDIKPLIVRQLMLSTFTLPPNTNKNKRLATKEMKDQIELFKKTLKVKKAASKTSSEAKNITEEKQFTGSDALQAELKK